MSEPLPRAAGPAPGGRIEPRLHDPPEGIPYYDRELDVAQSSAHRIMVTDTTSVLEVVGREAGLTLLSDEPIWYLHPETDEQRVYYGDCVLGAVDGTERITAEELALVIEVVSTNDRRKELKDTGFQRLLNEYNGVPEFGLLFPEVDDPRAITWCRLRDGRYAAHDVAPGGVVEVEGVPGLALQVKPRAEWAPGRKIDIVYRGEHRLPVAGERERARHAEQRAETAEQRAETADKRAAELAEKLRALGVDPDEP